MPEELTLLPCPLCQARAHGEYHNGYLRVICEGESGCPFRMGGKRFVFPDECYDWWNTLPRALEWTNEPPKVPGLYWNRSKNYSNEACTLKVTQGRIEQLVRMGCSQNEQWAGPIPEPREQK